MQPVFVHAEPAGGLAVYTAYACARVGTLCPLSHVWGKRSVREGNAPVLCTEIGGHLYTVRSITP